MTTKTIDDNFSKYVRLYHSKDGYCQCATCGKWEKWNSGTMDTGHFMTRNNKSTRWELKNCLPQCRHCNSFAGGKQYEMSLMIDKVYGKGTADLMLLKSKQHKKWADFELKELNKYFREQIKELG